MPNDLPDHWGWPNFSPDELRCKHTGQLIIHRPFLDRLQALRTALGFAFPISSGYRAPSHPSEARKAQPGAHSFARAVDIRVYGERAFQIVAAAPGFHFTGIGVSQDLTKDPGGRFIHLDDMTAADGYHAPRPFLWSY